MKKNISRNPLWPDWYNGKKIDEVQFGRAFLEQWPLKCVNGTLYTLDGPVEDESEIKQRILENIEEYVTSACPKRSPTFWRPSSCWTMPTSPPCRSIWATVSSPAPRGRR